jgi:hypothetical protein
MPTAFVVSQMPFRFTMRRFFRVLWLDVANTRHLILPDMVRSLEKIKLHEIVTVMHDEFPHCLHASFKFS